MSLMKMKSLRLGLVICCVFSTFLFAEDYVEKPYLTNPKTDGITISWIAEKQVSGKIHYGETEAYGQTANEVKIIKVDKDRGGYAYKDKPELVIHRVRLSGLKPGTKYFYKVEIPQFSAFANSFYTINSAPTSTVAFIFGGDRVRFNDSDVEFVESKIGKPLDFFLDVGDHTVERFAEDVPKSWQGRVPTIVARGNHDDEKAHKGEIVAFFDFDEDKLMYSISWGPLFLIIDGESIYKPRQAEDFVWIEKQFGDTKLPWKAYSCHGVFFTDSDHFAEGPARVAQYWPMFMKQGVQLEINGHDHDYQRTDRVDREGKPDAKGVVSLTYGGVTSDLHGKSSWSAFQWPPLPEKQMQERAEKLGSASRYPKLTPQDDKYEASAKLSKSEKHAVPFLVISGDTARLEMWTGSGTNRVLRDSYTIKLP
jgi:hypothetical protein